MGHRAFLRAGSTASCRLRARCERVVVGRRQCHDAAAPSAFGHSPGGQCAAAATKGPLDAPPHPPRRLGVHEQLRRRRGRCDGTSVPLRGRSLHGRHSRARYAAGTRTVTVGFVSFEFNDPVSHP
eukprot:5667793-Prymnesium_polylepis.1